MWSCLRYHIWLWGSRVWKNERQLLFSSSVGVVYVIHLRIVLQKIEGTHGTPSRSATATVKLLWMLSTSCWTRRQIVKILKCPSSVQYCPLNNLSFPLQVKPNTLFQWQVYSGPSMHLKLNLRKCDMQYPVRMALSWEFWSWKFWSTRPKFSLENMVRHCKNWSGLKTLVLRLLSWTEHNTTSSSTKGSLGNSQRIWRSPKLLQ